MAEQQEYIWCYFVRLQTLLVLTCGFYCVCTYSRVWSFKENLTSSIIVVFSFSTGMKCLFEDSVYNPWQRFVNEKCTGYCTCNGRSGSVGCVSLCPPSPVPWCAQGELPETRMEPVPAILDQTGKCGCKRKSCNPRPNLPPPPPLGGSMKHHRE